MPPLRTRIAPLAFLNFFLAVDGLRSLCEHVLVWSQKMTSEMVFGSSDSKDPNVVMSGINMILLIYVMLILLVIFIITAPLLT